MSEDFEIDKVDKKELAKQLEEKILKGEHTELRILIGTGDEDPICSLINKGSTYRELGMLYKCLEQVRNMIKSRYPMAVMYAQECLEFNGRTEIDMNK
jgi:hypothetical protein